MYRWFKVHNVCIAGERQQRKLAQGIVGENLVAERGAFIFPTDKDGDEVREAPFVYVPNLIAKIADAVAQHERQVLQLLKTKYTWNYVLFRSPDGLINHGGAIPDDELWVKLGGDKGRGSFKFNFQLVNIPHPNSVKKTILLSVFKAGDNTSNLHIALDRYKEHIQEAQGMQIT